jgi:hypothetical protein
MPTETFGIYMFCSENSFSRAGNIPTLNRKHQDPEYSGLGREVAGGHLSIQVSKFVEKNLPASSLSHVYSISTNLLVVKNGIVVTPDFLSDILRA